MLQMIGLKMSKMMKELANKNSAFVQARVLDWMLLAGGRLYSFRMLTLNCHFCLKRNCAPKLFFFYLIALSCTESLRQFGGRKMIALCLLHAHKAPVSLFPWLHLAARSRLCVHKAARRWSAVPRYIIGLSCDPVWWILQGSENESILAPLCSRLYKWLLKRFPPITDVSLHCW